MKRLSTHLYELAPAPGPGAPVAIQCPFAGGNVHSLREYRDLLPDHHHLAVHYPGRGFRLADAPAPSLTALGSAVADEYLALAPPPGTTAPRPPQLIGHSMGAYVALEAAHRLQTRNADCAGLLVSSSLPPGTPVTTDSPLRILTGGAALEEATDDELTAALISGGALSPEITDEPELLAMILPVLRHDCALVARYTTGRPTPTVHCPVIAFGAHDDGAVPPDTVDHWRDITDGPFTTRIWPGDHFWFRTPHPDVRRTVEDGLRTDRPHGDPGAPRCATALLHAQVRARPHDTAVVDDGVSHTYADLWEASGRIAGHLHARGVKEGDIIGIRAARGLPAIAATLGIARCGAMYLPLNEDDPPHRRALILRDARPALLLVDDGPARPDTDPPELPLAPLLADPAAPPAPPGPTRPDTALYVMYTSGSTGVPKGVVIEHGGVVNLVTDPGLDLTADRVIGHCATDAFDVSTYEIWGALCNGGTCVVLPVRTLLDPVSLDRAVTGHGIDTLFATTAVLNYLAEEAPPALRRLHSLVFGGERASARHLRLLLDHFAGVPTRLVHAYGPTENTMMTTHIDITPHNCAQAPIGTVLHHMRAVLLTDSGALLTGDGRGELCVSGRSLARGYLNRPELTAERFVVLDLPTGPERVYRTGDDCERTDGVLRFLGRRDGMVKLRSHRVELGEVEAALGAHPDVLEAVVTLDDSPADEPHLAAYLRTADPVTPADLRRFLAERLPRHMIPTVFHTLHEFPLGTTGKVDRTALAALAAGGGRG